MKSLSVQKTSRVALLLRWGQCALILPPGELFIRSDRKGNVKWDSAPVYTPQEIEEEKKRRKVIFTLPKNFLAL